MAALVISFGATDYYVQKHKKTAKIIKIFFWKKLQVNFTKIA